MDTETRQIHNFREGDRFHDHYRLLEHVGSGGFADVWKAKDELVDTIVALKIYTRLDKDGISELAKEYKQMKGVKCPNLLTGNHFDACGNIPYLEMDYCDGGSLFNKIGNMTSQELRHMVVDVVKGLAYLHGEGIVHQDIKPENILYDTEHDRYLLSDFGISSKSRTRLSKSVNMANVTLSMTTAYAPPEKFSTKPTDRLPDTKSDIFSLGVTIYELSTGILPVDLPQSIGQLMFISQGKQPMYFDNIGDDMLRGIVMRCMDYRKDKRPTAEEIVKMLDGDVQIGQVKQKPIAKPPTVKIGMTSIGILNNNMTQPSEYHSQKHQFDDNGIVGASRQTVTDGVVPQVRKDGNELYFVVEGYEYCYKMVRVLAGRMNPFYIGETQVTQALWMAVMGSNPSYFKGNNRPVENVSWIDCKDFIARLNRSIGSVFRLPHENEWEYAAKGGEFVMKQKSFLQRNRMSKTKYSGCDSERDLEQYAWYDYNAYYCGSINENRSHPDYGTHIVKTRKPNELGLYDMSGNVWEWCEDLKMSTGSERIVRGGAWNCNASFCIVSNRFGISPSYRNGDLGFRLAI